MDKQINAAEQIANDIMARHLRIEQMKAYDDVRKYNANPKSVEDKDLPRILQNAEKFGYSVSAGSLKDTHTFWEALGAIGGGAADAILLDLLKDSWYSTRRTKDFKTAGKILGLATALFLPTSWLAGAKGANWATKTLNFGTTFGLGKLGRTAYSQLAAGAAKAAAEAGKKTLLSKFFANGLVKTALKATPYGIAIGSKLFPKKEEQQFYGQMPQMPRMPIDQQ